MTEQIVQGLKGEPAGPNGNARRTVTSVHERPPAYDGDKYYSHLLDQYKVYLEMVDRLSARRVLVNNSFITLMGAGALAYSAAPTHLGKFAVTFQLGIALASMLIAILWRETILHYRDLSTTKFRIIHEMEELLPAQPYRLEYQYFISEREKLRTPFARSLAQMESVLPVIGAIISAFGFAYAGYLILSGAA